MDMKENTYRLGRVLSY